MLTAVKSSCSQMDTFGDQRICACRRFLDRGLAGISWTCIARAMEPAAGTRAAGAGNRRHGRMALANVNARRRWQLKRSIDRCRTWSRREPSFPLRGGDALRVVLVRAGTRSALHPCRRVGTCDGKSVRSDRGSCIRARVDRCSFCSNSSESQLNVVPIAIAILMVATAALLTARSGLMIRAFRWVARATHLPARLYRHLLRPLHHLRESATPGRIVVLLIETAVIWLVLYVLAYLAIAQLVGMSLSVAEAMVLLFAAALGLAIPARPLGSEPFTRQSFLRSCFSGGRLSDGLVLAVAIHGVFFIGFCATGGVALAIASHGSGPLRCVEKAFEDLLLWAASSLHRVVCAAWRLSSSVSTRQAESLTFICRSVVTMSLTEADRTIARRRFYSSQRHASL